MNTTTRENFQRLIEAVKALPATPTAVAHPCDESSLAGTLDAAKLGIIEPIFVVPDLEGGNLLAKSLSFLADADSAGPLVGACTNQPHPPRRFGTEPPRFIRRRGGDRSPPPRARGEGELT
jgi:hypothetical protein